MDFDFCIGADGSYSVIRRQMMRVVRWVFFLETCLRSRKNFTSFPFGTFGFARMDYQQEYIKHEYVELKMPAGRDSEGKSAFLLDPNHLHIWPRHTFMLIALPNKVKSTLVNSFSRLEYLWHYLASLQDKTFTCTLFAPSTDLDRLCSADTILSWFKTYFPDALLMIGEKALVNDFTRNPRSPLICTKVISPVNCSSQEM